MNMCMCVYMLVHQVILRLKLACKYGHVCLHVSSSGHHQTKAGMYILIFVHVCLHVNSSHCHHTKAGM